MTGAVPVLVCSHRTSTDVSEILETSGLPGVSGTVVIEREKKIIIIYIDLNAASLVEDIA